ncbi:tetratricopeptide repeat-containing sensor histidine kinase [Flavobacterium sp. 25HG05S-40]|uniref:tetratricopeptide repeat-containing sensor histidine kinase n=1 Tax=Flavobacterium sp. 25HG05S-40 TaxID=3458682 RepID=UPI004044BD27
MKNQLILLLFWCIGGSLGYAQNAQVQIENLKNELKTHPDAKRTAVIYSDLTWYYANVSSDSALSYGKKAISESTRLGDSTLIAQVYSDLGAVYFTKGDLMASKKSFLSSMEIRKAQKDIPGIAKLNANLANIYYKLGENPKALKAYLASIDYFEKTNRLDLVATTKTNVGILFHKIKNYPKALTYLKEAQTYQEKNNLETGLCLTYLSLGNVYLHMKDTLNAVKFYDKSIVYSKKTGNKVSLTNALNNLGNIKSQQGKSKEALAIFNKSKKIRDSINFDTDDSTLLLGYAKDHIMNRRFTEAKELLLEMERSYIKNKKDKRLLLKTYQFLIPTCGYLNEPDSVYLYTNEVGMIEDEIIETAVAKQTIELEEKYQSEKKEKLLLQKEMQIKATRSQLILVSSVAIFIGLLGFLFYRQQKLKNKQQEQEFQLKSAIAKIETQNKLQEQRLQISRDLHDNIGSQLTFIISSVDNIKYAFDIQNSKLDNKLSSISNFAKSTIIELRDTIWAMNNSEITFEDLQSRIHNFVEKAKEAKQDIAFGFSIEESLQTATFTSIEGMNIYRTIQEAVNNSIKYADAKHIKIDIKQLQNDIVMVISDDGKGFDDNDIELGNGINNMKKRIAECNGTIALKTKPNEGTEITIQFPNKFG